MYGVSFSRARSKTKVKLPIDLNECRNYYFAVGLQKVVVVLLEERRWLVFFVVDVPRYGIVGWRRVDEWMTITSFSVEGVREWLSSLGAGPTRYFCYFCMGNVFLYIM